MRISREARVLLALVFVAAAAWVWVNYFSQNRQAFTTPAVPLASLNETTPEAATQVAPDVATDTQRTDTQVAEPGASAGETSGSAFANTLAPDTAASAASVGGDSDLPTPVDAAETAARASVQAPVQASVPGREPSGAAAVEGDGPAGQDVAPAGQDVAPAGQDVAAEGPVVGTAVGGPTVEGAALEGAALEQVEPQNTDAASAAQQVAPPVETPVPGASTAPVLNSPVLDSSASNSSVSDSSVSDTPLPDASPVGIEATPLVDSSALDGAAVDGAAVDSLGVDGAVINSTAVDGSAPDAPVVEPAQMETGQTEIAQTESAQAETAQTVSETTVAQTTDTQTTDAQTEGGERLGAVATDGPLTAREVEVAELPFLVTEPPALETPEAGAAPGLDLARPNDELRATVNPFSPILLAPPPEQSQTQVFAAPSVAPAGSSEFSLAPPSTPSGIVDVPIPDAPAAAGVPIEVSAPQVPTRITAPAPQPLTPRAGVVASLPRPLPGGTLPVTPDLLRTTRAEPVAAAATPEVAPLVELAALRVPGRATSPNFADAAPPALPQAEANEAEPLPLAGTSGRGPALGNPIAAGTSGLTRFLRDGNYRFTGYVISAVGVGVFRSNEAATPVIVNLGQTIPGTDIVLTSLKGEQAELTLEDEKQILILNPGG